MSDDLGLSALSLHSQPSTEPHTQTATGTGTGTQQQQQQQQQRVNRACRFFAAGKCSLGDACRYRHDPPRENAASKSSTPKPAAEGGNAASAASAGNPRNNARRREQRTGEQGVSRQASKTGETAAEGSEDSSAASSSPTNPSGSTLKICRFFNSSVGCRRGADCKYLHAAQAPKKAKPVSEEQDTASSTARRVEKPKEARQVVARPRTEQTLKAEIQNLKKRFPTNLRYSVVQVANSEGQVLPQHVMHCVLVPSDPEWPAFLDIHEIPICFVLPALYPKVPLHMKVEGDQIPEPIQKFINAALVKEKSALFQQAPGELMARALLRWLDNNLTQLFVDAGHAEKRRREAASAGLQFIAAPQNRSVDDFPIEVLKAEAEGKTVDPATINLDEVPSIPTPAPASTLSPAPVAPAAAPAAPLPVSKDTKAQGTVAKSETKKNEAPAIPFQFASYVVKRDDEDDIFKPKAKAAPAPNPASSSAKIQTPKAPLAQTHSPANLTASSNGTKVEVREENAAEAHSHSEEGGEEYEGEDGEYSESEGEYAEEGEQLEGAADHAEGQPADGGAASSTLLDVERRGTEVKLKGLELRGVALLSTTELVVLVACDRCKDRSEVKIKVQNGAGTSSAVCNKCHSGMSIGFRGTLVHEHNAVLGFLDLNACTPFEVILPASTFIAECAECSDPVKVTTLPVDQLWTSVCFKCHQRLSLRIEGTRMTKITHSGVANAPPIPQAQPRRRRVVDNLQLGSPLPENGTCVHYRKSYRWLRFPCCGRLFPCDTCHAIGTAGECQAKLSEDRTVILANRMVCGFCSKEQPFSQSPCVNCGAALTAGSSGNPFWEGGKGARDPSRLSKKDPHKGKILKKIAERRAEQRRAQLNK